MADAHLNPHFMWGTQVKNDEGVNFEEIVMFRKYHKDSVKWARLQKWQIEEFSNLGDDDHAPCEICFIPLWRNDKKYTNGQGNYLCGKCYRKFIKEI